MVDWANTWGMSFNVQKCKVMHTGRGNPRAQYMMAGSVLSTTDEERDIGVIVCSNLRPSRQCAEAARRGMGVLGQIQHAFHYRDKHVTLNLT